MPTDNTPLSRLMASYHDQPALFVRELFNACMEEWQEEALGHIAESDRLAVRSGHGVGKTTFLAWVIIWFLGTRHDAKVICTAPAAPQLKNQLWPELRKWVDALRQSSAVGEWLAEQYRITDMRMTIGDGTSFAVGRTARPDQPEALQGAHATNLLFVVDEASAVSDLVFETAQGSLSTPGAKLILTGNPTRPGGYFFDAFHKLRALFRCMAVSCLSVSSARVGNYPETMRQQYGEDSNIYRVRVLGEFPTGEESVVIPLHLLESAVGRDIDAQVIKQIRPVWGLDVALGVENGDDSVLVRRRGPALEAPPQVWRGLDLMALTGQVAALYFRMPEAERPAHIMVDVIGIGAGVAARLRELGLPVRQVNVAEAAPLSNETGAHINLRSWLWWEMRRWAETLAVTLPPGCDDLIAQMSGVGFTITSAGKMQLHSKDQIRRQLGRSPDLADAFALTFALPDRPTAIAARETESLRRNLHGSAMPGHSSVLGGIAAL